MTFEIYILYHFKWILRHVMRFFDILTPPYNPQGGRDCTYFEYDGLRRRGLQVVAFARTGRALLTRRSRPDFGMEPRRLFSNLYMSFHVFI